MKHERLHALADGIFAIAMTLLVLELRVPEINGATNAELLQALKELLPSLYSFILSFFLLFIYWRGFNAVIGTLAKTLSSTLVLYSAVFLLFISLVPFSSYFFGRYSSTQVGVAMYAANLVLIGVMMHVIRRHIVNSPDVEVADHWTQRDHRNATIRVVVPILSSLIAVAISFKSTKVAGLLLLSNVALNVFNRSFDPIYYMLDKLSIGVNNEQK